MAWLPNGDMLITEKPGRLRMVRDGQLLPEAIPGTPEVLYKGQGGLFEVVPHPDFNENQWVYLTFAKPNANDVDDGSTTAIASGRLQVGRLTNGVELFAAQAAGFGHYGGKLVFGGEGHMFLTLGDRQDFSFGDREALMAHSAQDRTNHKGVIVRLNDDGTVPDDNPFVGVDGVLPEIWSYGHRSPQGLAIHPITGDLWESEHGPQGGERSTSLSPATIMAGLWLAAVLTTAPLGGPFTLASVKGHDEPDQLLGTFYCDIWPDDLQRRQVPHVGRRYLLRSSGRRAAGKSAS